MGDKEGEERNHFYHNLCTYGEAIGFWKGQTDVKGWRKTNLCKKVNVDIQIHMRTALRAENSSALPATLAPFQTYNILQPIKVQRPNQNKEIHAIIRSYLRRKMAPKCQTL